jgi:vacuolar-type H+-ATPase subunit C/Vma6
VTRGWEDLVARAGGLATHLFGRTRLAALARTKNLAHLAAELDQAYGPAVGAIPDASAEQLEIAVRRAAASCLRLLARWSGPRGDYLAPLLLDEDRRSIRAVLRGAAAGSPPSERLAGLIPTPALPERALEELARQPSVSRVAALLTAWGHPFGSSLLAGARLPQPDLLDLDLRLATAYAISAGRAARAAPSGEGARRELLAFVRETMDIENASTAMQLAAQRSSTEPARLFLPEGHLLDRASFLAAARAPSARAAAAILARSFRGSPLARAVAEPSRAPFEDAAFVAELRRTIDAARRTPLGVAPVIAFLMRLRAEVRDLRLIIWRIALGAPPVAPDALLTVS